MVENDVPLFALFFMLGAGVFVVGVLRNLSVWLRGKHSWRASARTVAATIFSRRIVTLAAAFGRDVLWQRRLLEHDKLRWLMKTCIIFGYLGVITVNELRVAQIPELDGRSHLLLLFFAPFGDFYYLKGLGAAAAAATLNTPGGYPFTSTQALLASLNDVFEVMVIAGWLIAFTRRFVKRAFPLKTLAVEHAALFLLGGWFLFRLLAEAVTIVAFQVPSEVARHWTVAGALATGLGRLPLSASTWAAAYTVLWPLSAALLGFLFGSIPFNAKLWHIFTTPLVTLMSSVPRPKLADVDHMPSRVPFTTGQLMELDACVRCQVCTDVCQVAQASLGGNDNLRQFRSYADINTRLRTWAHSKKPLGAEAEAELGADAYYCFLCGRCREVCPAHIDTFALGATLRRNAYLAGCQPKLATAVVNQIVKSNTLLATPKEARTLYLEYDDPSRARHIKPKAEVLYYVGCFSSIVPRVQHVPTTVVCLLERAGVDFTVLGGEEICCGYPMAVSGATDQMHDFMVRNVEMAKRTGAKTILFSCPTCFNVWTKDYTGLDGIELIHHTQYFARLIKEGKLVPSIPVAMRVAYHDPCDLGRKAGIVDAPRELLQSIPGLQLREFPHHGKMSYCCGGSAMTVAYNNELAGVNSVSIVMEAAALGIQAIVSSCGGCNRTLQITMEQAKSPMAIFDVAEILNMALEPPGRTP
ncbi:MAG: (Fe-S)-binding protein [Deltaproteobacteria bacterium]|nr:(Fe-S)-binding protein [Deltaproteobacteria bacterium]